MGAKGTPNTIRRLLPYAVFAALVCVFLWRPIFRGDALLPGDYLAQMSPWSTVSKAPNPPPQWNPLQWDAISQFYPWRVFYARSIRQGKIPLWNPYQFSGTPFLANGQSAVLYPLNAVFLVFDPISAFTLYAALHLFLAAAFMYLLLRALGCSEGGGIVGGICYAFCAFMVLWLELPTFIGAAVWAPLVPLLVHRAVEQRSAFHGMLAGAALAMAFLAGHFQIAFYVAMCAGLWWLWKLGAVWREEGKAYTFLKVVLPCVAFLAIVGLLTAAQVLPTVELAQNSHRVREISPEGYARFVANAVKPYRLVTAFIPDFFGNPSRGDYFLGSAADYMEYGLYIGILPLVLALIAFRDVLRRPHIAFFAVASLVAILTAIGTPINYLFYRLIPGFSALGGPNRILLLYFLGVAGLAGFGMDYIDRGLHSDSVAVAWRLRRSGLIITAALVVCGFGFLAALIASTRFVSALGIPSDLSSFDGLFGSSVWRAVEWLMVSALVLATATLRRRDPYVLTAMVSLLIVADLFAFGINYNPSCDRSKVYPETELTTRLKQIAGDARIAPINPSWSLYQTPDAILPPNAAMVYGLRDVQGYDSLFTRRYKDKIDAILGEDSSPVENGNMVLVKHYTQSLGSIADFAVSRGPIEGPKLVAQADGAYVYQLNETLRTRAASPIRSCRPFSFEFGLFLSCVGLGAVAGTGTYRLLKLRRQRDR